MAGDDDFVEGDSSSAAADAPGVVPTDDAPDRAPAAKQGGFDSSSTQDAPVVKRSTKASHTAEARKAFAKAIVEAKSKPAPPPTGAAAELADLDPEAAPAETAPIAASADAAKAKINAADILAAPIPTPAAAPPAPSLDPEVRKLREYLTAERQKLEAERAEFDKARAPAPVTAAEPTAASLEDYIDHAPRAFRGWLESMRGEKMTDEEFKAEVSDFITQSSADVLGVPLPDAVRTKLEAQLARKAVRTSKVIQTKREAAAAAKLEAERKAFEERTTTEQLEREWTNAAHAVGSRFSPTQDATGAAKASEAASAYPWLAAEDEPGKIVVDVIRAAVNKDGTQMTWQEAAKRANDYLQQQATGYIEKRKSLLAPKPAPVAPKPPAAAAPVPAAPTPPAPVETRAPANPSKWTRDKHVENTKAAFRKMIAGQG